MTAAPSAERLAILDSLRRSRSVVIDYGKSLNATAHALELLDQPDKAAKLSLLCGVLLDVVHGLSELIAAIGEGE